MMADILTDEQVAEIEREHEAFKESTGGVERKDISNLIATLRHVQAKLVECREERDGWKAHSDNVHTALIESEQGNARLRDALYRIVKYYDIFDEDAEGFKQAMSDPYAIAQKALATEGELK